MNNPSPPPAPDPVAVANAQSAANRSTAITQYGLNATNQVTPYGNLTYSQNGTWSDGTPRFTATTTLSPEQQALYDRATQTQKNFGDAAVAQSGRVSGVLGTPFDLNAATSTQQSDIQRRLLDPVWQTRENQLQTKLRDQGIVPGSEAYTNAMRDFGMQRDNSYDANLLASRSQAVSEALANRNQPLTELSALLSGTQPQQPNFVNTPQTNVAPTDVLGAYKLNADVNMNNYNAQLGSNNAMYGALGSIAGGALGGWGMGGFKMPKTG